MSTQELHKSSREYPTNTTCRKYTSSTRLSNSTKGNSEIELPSKLDDWKKEVKEIQVSNCVKMKAPTGNFHPCFLF